MVDLNRILDLRNLRHDKLQRKLSVAQEICAHARKELFHAQKEMDAFAQKMRTFEVDLLTDLLKTRLQKTDFDIFAGKLKKAEEEATKLVSRHDSATVDVQKTERTAERVRRETATVQSKINKLSRLQSILDEEGKDAELRAMDAQSDDIAEVMFAWSRGL
jgi:flagellar biosynthesis chaperone FliJ